MKKKIYKTTSLLLIIAMVMTNNYCYGYPTLFKTKSHAQRYLKDEADKPAANIVDSPLSIEIPENLGRVVESYKGKGDSLIIHIQDRHSDPVAQLNIAGVIDEFVAKHETELICLEGASKELDTSFYDRFPDNDIKKKTSEFFLKEGVFTGAEYYKITNKDKYIRVEGAEDKRAYLEHLSIYRSNGIDKDELLGLLNTIATSLNLLKDKAYSENLKSIEKVSVSYDLKQIKLPGYLKALEAYAKKAGYDIAEHENLSRFIELADKEEKIDFKKAETERELVIKELSGILQEADLDSLIDKSLQFRIGKIAQEEFYDYLYTLIGKEKIEQSKYKELTAYADYIRFSKSINHLAVFDEAEEAEEEVKIALSKTAIQKELVLYGKAVEILKDLYSLKLTRRQLDYMDSRGEFFDISKMQNFLEIAFTRYGLTLSPAVRSARIDQNALDRSKRYYQVALKRDIALLDNTLNSMERYRKDKAILITGGFHTDGIRNILKEKDISYIIICPNIGAEDCEEIYNARMAGKLPDITELAEFLHHTLVAPLITADMSRAETVGQVKAAFAALVELPQDKQWGSLSSAEQEDMLLEIWDTLAQSEEDSLSLQDIQGIISETILARTEKTGEAKAVIAKAASAGEAKPVHVAFKHPDGLVNNFIFSRELASALEKTKIDAEELIREAVRTMEEKQSYGEFTLRLKSLSDQTIWIVGYGFNKLADFLSAETLKPLLIAEIYYSIMRKKAFNIFTGLSSDSYNPTLDLTDYLIKELGTDRIVDLWIARLQAQYSPEAVEMIYDKIKTDYTFDFRPEHYKKLQEFYDENKMLLDNRSRKAAIFYLITLILRSGQREKLRDKLEELQREREEQDRISEELSKVTKPIMEVEFLHAPTSRQIDVYEKVIAADPNKRSDREHLAYLRQKLKQQQEEEDKKSSARLKAESFANKAADQIFSVVAEALSSKDLYLSSALLTLLADRKGLTLGEMNLALCLLSKSVADYATAIELLRCFTENYRRLLVSQLLHEIDIAKEQRTVLENLYYLMFNDTRKDRENRIAEEPALANTAAELLVNIEDNFMKLKTLAVQHIQLVNSEIADGNILDFSKLCRFPTGYSKTQNLESLLEEKASLSAQERLAHARNYFRATHDIELEIPFFEETSFVDTPESPGGYGKATLYSRSDIEELLKQLILLDRSLSILPHDIVLHSLTLQKITIVKEMRASWGHSEAVKNNKIFLALGMDYWRRTLYHELGHSLHGPKGGFATYVNPQRIKEIIIKHKDFFEKADPSLLTLINSQEFEETKPEVILHRIFMALYNYRLQEWKAFNNGIGVTDMNEPFKRRLPQQIEEGHLKAGIQAAQADTKPSLSVDYMFEIPLEDALSDKNLIRDNYNELVAEYTQLYILFPESLRMQDAVAHDLLAAIIGDVAVKSASAGEASTPTSPESDANIETLLHKALYSNPKTSDYVDAPQTLLRKVTSTNAAGIIAQLASAMESPDDSVRSSAMFLLSVLYERGYAIDRSVFRKAISDKDITVRADAASALHRIEKDMLDRFRAWVQERVLLQNFVVKVSGQDGKSLGSGFAIAEDAEYMYIATNTHVIGGRSTLNVIIGNNTANIVDGRIIVRYSYPDAGDAHGKDIALLAVEKSRLAKLGVSLTPMKLARSADFVGKYTCLISGLYYTVRSASIIYSDVTYLNGSRDTDSSESGDSGSPLIIEEDGEPAVAGLNVGPFVGGALSFKKGRGQTLFDEMAMAIPLDQLKEQGVFITTDSQLLKKALVAVKESEQAVTLADATAGQAKGPIAKSASAGQAEQEAKEFLETQVDIFRLESDFGQVIKIYGYVPFKELYIAAGRNSYYLFKFGLPAVASIFTPEELKIYWPSLLRLGLAAGTNSWFLFGFSLPAVKDLITDIKSLNQTVDDLLRLGLAAGTNSSRLLSSWIPAAASVFTPEELKTHWLQIVYKLEVIHSSGNKYNRERLLSLFGDSYLPMIKQFKSDFIRWIDFYIEIIQKEPRLCLQVLEGVYTGLQQGIISGDLSAQEKEQIISFAGLTRSFSPSLFKLYKKQGKSGLGPVLDFDKKVSMDKAGEAQIRDLEVSLRSQGITEESELNEAVVSSVQMAIPSSGASFVKKAEVQGLFAKFRQIGDRREDIPQALRDRDFGNNQAIELMEYLLKPGQVYDPDGKISAIIDKLRYKDRDLPEQERKQKEAKERQEFIQSLISWLGDFSNQARKSLCLDKFFACISHNDSLGEKIDALMDDYNSVLLLETLFMDKDNLAVILREVLKKDISQSLLPQKTDQQESKKAISNPKAVLSQINGIWNSELDLTQKTERIARVVSIFKQDEITAKILPNIQDLKLKEIVANSIIALSKATFSDIVEEFFREPLGIIQQEKAKFAPQEKGKVDLEFRVVKGIPFGLWGLNAGVCIATDIDLWNNPNFMLVAIIDKATHQAVGFVHLFKVNINGQDVLVIPGIEPSVEFLSQVKAEAVYPLIEEALINIADTGKFAELYFPVEPNVLSNRGDIAKIINRRFTGKNIILDNEIQWNAVPQPYPIKEVYVVWKKQSPVLTTITKSASAGEAEELADRVIQQYREFAERRADLITFINLVTPAHFGGAFAKLPAKTAKALRAIFAHWDGIKLNTLTSIIGRDGQAHFGKAFQDAPILTANALTKIFAIWDETKLKTLTDIIGRDGQAHFGKAFENDSFSAALALELIFTSWDNFYSKDAPSLLTQLAKDLISVINRTPQTAFEFMVFFKDLINAGIINKDNYLIFSKSINSLKRHTAAVVFEKFAKYIGLLKSLTMSQLNSHISFYTEIAQQRGNLAGIIIEGLLEATSKGLIAKDLPNKEKAEIKAFIDRTNSFFVVLYGIYKDMETDQAKKELLDKLENYKRLIATNKFTYRELDEVLQLKPDLSEPEQEELIMAVFFLTIPPLDSSYTTKEHIRPYIKQILTKELKDPTDTIPSPIKKYQEEKTISVIERRVKEGAADNTDYLNFWIRRLSQKADKAPDEEYIVEQIMTSYQGKVSQDKLKALMEEYLRANPEFIKEIESLNTESDYNRWVRLQEKITDRLNYYLDNILQKVNRYIQPKQRIKSTESVLALLSGEKLPQTQDKIRQVLFKYDHESLAEIQKAVASSVDPIIMQRRQLVNDVITELLSQQQLDIQTQQSLVRLIYKEELEKLSEQIDRYELSTTGETTITCRVAKGLPYIVWGLNSGVCVGQDINLFKDPNFILVPIFDKDNIARGVIYFYRAQGKLFLAGIHPDTAFLEDKDPDEILKTSLDIAYDIADKLGYDKFYIPTSETIHSNRADIKKAIERLVSRLNLKPQDLEKKVEWQKKPGDYSFSNVWEFNNTVKLEISAISAKSASAGEAKPEAEITPSAAEKALKASSAVFSLSDSSALIESGRFDVDTIRERMAEIYQSILLAAEQPDKTKRDAKSEEILKEKIRNGNVTLALQDGEIIGYIIHTIGTKYNRGYLDMMCVLSDAQRGRRDVHIGTALMDAAGNWFKEHNMAAVVIEPIFGSGGFYNRYFGVNSFTDEKGEDIMGRCIVNTDDWIRRIADRQTLPMTQKSASAGETEPENVPGEAAKALKVAFAGQTIKEVAEAAEALLDACVASYNVPFYDVLGEKTPYSRGLIIYDTVLRDDKRIIDAIKYFSELHASNKDGSKFIILVNTTKAREDVVKAMSEQGIFLRNNVSTVDDFLTNNGVDDVAALLEDQKIIIATELLKRRCVPTQEERSNGGSPIGIIAGARADVDKIAASIKQKDIKGVYIVTPDASDIVIDGKSYDHSILFEALLVKAATKIRDYSPGSYSYKDLIEILPPMTTFQELMNVYRQLEAATKAIKTAA